MARTTSRAKVQMSADWKQFSENALTHTEAHFLMTIRTLIADRGYARAIDVAEEMDLARSTVSQRIRQLMDKGWVQEDEARHLKLAETGDQLAGTVLERREIL